MPSLATSFRAVQCQFIGMCCLLMPAVLLADGEAPISTERPSFSSSPLALAPSTVQLEAGYQFTDDTANVQTLPLALLRVGLFERVELQVS